MPGHAPSALVAAALLAAGVLLVAPSAVGVPSAKADNCPDVAVTFARGTDEPAGLGRVGDALVDSLRQNTGKNIDAYPVNYRATLLQLHGNDGAKDAIKHIKDVADKCPATPQVLGGYSQGASVVDIVTGTQIGGVGWGDSLPPQYASHVIAVTTFGNPADRSGGTIAAQSAMFGAKAVDYCNPEDPICHAGQGNEWKGHTDGYVPVYTSQAASFVQTRLLSVLPADRPRRTDGRPAWTRAARRPARAWAVRRSARTWSRTAARPQPRRPGPDRGQPDPARGISLIRSRHAELRRRTTVRAMKLRSIGHTSQSIPGKFAARRVARLDLGACPGLDPAPDGIRRLPRRRGGVRPRATGIARRRGRRQRLHQRAAVQGQPERQSLRGALPRRHRDRRRRQRHERPRPAHDQRLPEHPHRAGWLLAGRGGY